MLETVTLITFATMLIAGIAFDLPLLAVLILGWVLFFDYGLLRGHTMAALARMSLKGMRSVASVLVLFALIGALTATWRVAGTLPAITCWSVRMIGPTTLVPASFLLCCLMSILTGSSFATSATTGVICMTVATSMGANPMLVGGAILSGSFFGDQCSPMSSSASLVANITGTDLLDNVGRMVRTGAIPFVACALLYLAFGATFQVTSDSSAQMAASVVQAFRSYDLSWVVLLPVVTVFVLCLLRVDVKLTMLASLGVAVLVALLVQGVSVQRLIQAIVFGYHSADPAIARLADGGGIVSMGEIAAIVCVASTYSGLFEGTELLASLGSAVTSLARKTTPFAGVLVTSVATAAIACDQVVAIMLVRQLCDECEGAGTALALDLETSVTLVPALIPWSTSCVGIMAFTGMPLAATRFAFLPMLVPLWTLGLSIWQSRHPAFVDGPAAQAMGLTEADDIRRLEVA